MYCVVFIPTGPRPLSAEAIVMLGFCLMARSVFSCRGVRLGVVLRRLKVVRMAWQKCSRRVSTIVGGRGALHIDLIRSLAS